MCGYDLRLPSRRRHRFSWIDALLVLAVLAVLGFWWRIASQPRQEQADGNVPSPILPTNIPLMDATPVITDTIATTQTTPVQVETPTTGPVVSSGVGSITHVVREGETLLAIATIYDVTVEEIQAANGLSDVLIRVGDELIIPVSPVIAQQGTTSGVSSQFEYTVQQGDTVVSIAVRVGSTIEEILRLNNLTPNSLIRPGDVLLVPVRQVPPEVLASSPAAQPTSAAAPSAPAVNTPAPVVYSEPRAVNPPNGAVVPRTESVLLQWVSVDVLEANEWYVLLLYPDNGAQTLPSIWTKATSYRLGTEIAPAEGERVGYTWQVSVVRVLPGVRNQYALEAASPPSEVRTFTWQ